MITKTAERTDVGVQNTASCVDRAGADPLLPLACAQEPKRLNEPRARAIRARLNGSISLRFPKRQVRDPGVLLLYSIY